jgi:hypothetical protein
LRQKPAYRETKKSRLPTKQADLPIDRRFANPPHKCFRISAQVEGFWKVGTLQAGVLAPR